MESIDTIAAIATAAGRGGIGIVRISGQNLPDFVVALIGSTPIPRYATLAAFRAADGTPIDRGIALFFPAPHSFTGEDVLELHGHGGDAVMRLLLQRCLDLGARLAAPGEFTRRAYLNDKIDLAQAESVADLIDAASSAAARCALRSLNGEFSRAVYALVEELIDARLRIEAGLDFPEEDIEALGQPEVLSKIAQVRRGLDRILAQARQGSILREGIQVALVGQPNVGKSSLLNRLAGEDVAIVTAVPGTTRDNVRSEIAIDGVPVRLVDTAGLRETADEVEQIGIERTWSALDNSDIALLLVDARTGISRAEQEVLERLPRELRRVIVHNKIDLTSAAPGIVRQPTVEIRLSAKTGAGIDLLRAHLLEEAGWRPSEEGAFLARERHLRALADARLHLSEAWARQGSPELLAEELRLAQLALAAITGEFTSDDLLGQIFSRFCIGK